MDPGVRPTRRRTRTPTHNSPSTPTPVRPDLSILRLLFSQTPFLVPNLGIILVRSIGLYSPLPSVSTQSLTQRFALDPLIRVRTRRLSEPTGLQ